MKKYLLITAATASLFTSNVFANSLVGVRGTLQQVDKAVKVSVQQAEKFFEERRGQKLANKINMLDDARYRNSPYLSNLYILDNFTVVLQLKNDNPSLENTEAGRGRNVSVPVAKALLGKAFIFVPIVNKGDEVINSWECITDADYQVQEFIGDAGQPEYTRSYVSSDTENAYLTTCIYLKDLSKYSGGVIRQKNQDNEDN